MKKLDNFLGLLTIIFIFFSFYLAEDAYSATYHVSGSGNNSGGLTWSSAWNDINQITDLTAGDTVYIAAGNYKGTYTFAASGSSGSPITIKRATTSEHGADTGWSNGYDGTVTITGSSGATIFTVSGMNNLVIDGTDNTKFVLNGNTSANYGVFGNGLSTHSIVIRNITAHHFLNTGINFGLSSGFGNNVEVANCELYKNGDGVSHETDGSIILLYAKSLGYGRNKIHDNSIHDGCITANLAACDLMTGNINYTDIYNNHFNSGWTTTSSSDMTHINGINNNIYNNIYETTGNNQHIFIHTNSDGSAHPDNNYIYNNIFYKPSSDVGNGAISFMAYAGGQISNIYIYSNTFYGHRWSVYLNASGSVKYTNIVLKNNIFWPNAVQHRHIMDNPGVFDSGQLILDHNFYYTGDSSTVLYKGSGNITVAGLQSLGSELHGGGGNPQFSSTANANGFYLTSKSPFPLIGGGYDFSNIFKFDKNGNTRLSGKWDLGPYSSSTTVVSPTPPGNLKLH